MHMLIDSHAHLDFASSDQESLRQIVTRAREAGVENIIHIGSGDGVKSIEQTPAIIDPFDDVYAAVGLHPHDAKLGSSAIYDRIREIAQHPKIIAIGEIGLDFHYSHSTRVEQAQVFRHLIQLAKDLGKPIMVHSREADKEILQIIRDEKAREVGGVFHCFSGDEAFGRKVLDENFHVSFSGIVTFKNAKVVQEAATKLPLEKMLIETDSPYLAPVPYRGKTNEPAYVRFVAEKIAELKGLSVEDVGRVTSLNARRLFGFGEQELPGRIAYPIRDSLYLNITNRCTLACKFCPKFSTFEVKGHYLKLSKEPSFEDMIVAMRDVSHYKEVVFCGFGEATMRLDLLKAIADYVHTKGVKVRLDTDGLGNLIYQRNILPELQGKVDAMSVSLNAPDAKTYLHLCPNRFGETAYQEVKKFILEAKKYIPWVQASVIGMPEIDVETCRKIVEEELGVRFRCREYDNVG